MMLVILKINILGHPSSGQNLRPTKLGMVIENLEHVLAAPKHFRV